MKFMPLEDNWLKKVELIHWFFLHKRFFKRLFTLILLLINLIIWGFFLYHLILYLISTPAHKAMLNELTQEWLPIVNYHQKITPLPLIVNPPVAIFLGRDNYGGRYSFVAEVQNQNEIWFAKSVVYKFVWGNEQTSDDVSFFLPQESKYLFSLNQTSSALPVDLRLEIKSVTWQRLRPTHLEKMKILKELSFRVIKFTPSIELEGKIIPATLQVEAQNFSAYNLRNVRMVIVVYQGRKIVSLDTTMFKLWRRGEKKNIDLNLATGINFATEIIVVPELNILETNTFLQP